MKVFVLSSHYNDDGPEGYDTVLAIYLHEEAAIRRCKELTALQKSSRIRYWVEEFPGSRGRVEEVSSPVTGWRTRHMANSKHFISAKQNDHGIAPGTYSAVIWERGSVRMLAKGVGPSRALAIKAAKAHLAAGGFEVQP